MYTVKETKALYLKKGDIIYNTISQENDRFDEITEILKNQDDDITLKMKEGYEIFCDEFSTFLVKVSNTIDADERIKIENNIYNLLFDTTILSQLESSNKASEIFNMLAGYIGANLSNGADFSLKQEREPITKNTAKEAYVDVLRLLELGYGNKAHVEIVMAHIRDKIKELPISTPNREELKKKFFKEFSYVDGENNIYPILGNKLIRKIQGKPIDIFNWFVDALLAGDNGWISVDKNPPKKDEKYYTCNEGDAYGDVLFFADDGYWYNRIGQVDAPEFYLPTRALPSPPTKQ